MSLIESIPSEIIEKIIIHNLFARDQAALYSVSKTMHYHIEQWESLVISEYNRDVPVTDNLCIHQNLANLSILTKCVNLSPVVFSTGLLTKFTNVLCNCAIERFNSYTGTAMMPRHMEAIQYLRAIIMTSRVVDDTILIYTSAMMYLVDFFTSDKVVRMPAYRAVRLKISADIKYACENRSVKKFMNILLSDHINSLTNPGDVTNTKLFGAYKMVRFIPFIVTDGMRCKLVSHINYRIEYIMNCVKDFAKNIPIFEQTLTTVLYYDARQHGYLRMSRLENYRKLNREMRLASHEIIENIDAVAKSHLIIQSLISIMYSLFIMLPQWSNISHRLLISINSLRQSVLKLCVYVNHPDVSMRSLTDVGHPRVIRFVTLSPRQKIHVAIMADIIMMKIMSAIDPFSY